VTSQGLLDQQHIALTTSSEARAAAAERMSSPVQGAFGAGRRSPDVTGWTLRNSALVATAQGSILLGRFIGIGPVPEPMDRIVDSIATRSGAIPLAEAFSGRSTRQHSLSLTVQQRTASPAIQRPDVLPLVTTIRDLIQDEQITAARRMLDLVPPGALEEPAIIRLRRALVPPTVTRSSRKDIDRTRAYEWLRQHAREYSGQWVAVAEDGVVATAPTLKELKQRLDQIRPTQSPLIHRL
jgi:hypothetical protein